MGVWTPVAYDAQQEFATEPDALLAARRAIPWLDEILDTGALNTLVSRGRQSGHDPMR